MLNHCLEWDKWVLTNFDHDRQWFNTLIPPSHESAAVTVYCISRLSGPVRLILRYITVDIHCRYEWDGGITESKLRITLQSLLAHPASVHFQQQLHYNHVEQPLLLVMHYTVFCITSDSRFMHDRMCLLSLLGFIITLLELLSPGIEIPFQFSFSSELFFSF